MLLLLSACTHTPPEVARPPVTTPTNLDFEAGLTGWGGGGEGYTLGLDPSGHAGQIRHLHGRGWAALTQCASPGPWLGQRLRLTGVLSTENVGYAGLWMRVDGPHPAFDNMQDRWRHGDSTAPAEVVLDVASDATRVCYGLLVGGAGTGTVDDLGFDVVSADVPTTEVDTGAHETPENLDFSAVGADGRPSGWFAGGEGYAIEAADGVVHISRNDEKRHDPFGGVTQCVSATPWRGRTLAVRARVRTEDVAEARIWVRADDGPAFDNLGRAPLVGTHDGGEVAATVTVPADAQEVCFGALLARAGRLTVDGFTLDPAP